MTPEAHEASHIFIELGASIVALALLGRLASRIGFSSIPLYLLLGLAFGNGGLAPLNWSADFIHVGAEIGVLLLLFMLGLEYTGEELKHHLRTMLPAGGVDLMLNFPPGLIAGFLLGWSPLASVLLGGVTYISSSGIIAKVLAELKRLDQPETTFVVSVLVLEDLTMAIYLPIVAVLLAGGNARGIITSVSIAIGTVGVILFVALRYGGRVSKLFLHDSDEIILLTTLGIVILVGGLAERLQVSAAIGAFLVGIALSGPIAKKSHQLLGPLRDLFAATFFFFFGLKIDPKTLPAVMPVAVALGVVSALTKVLTGFWTGKRAGFDRRGRIRAGMTLVARGEFSIVIAGLGAGVSPLLGPVAAAYVLLLAVLGPVLARVAP
jgi:monovalent cation:H+ antiporter-2, CPA2 family